MTHDLPMEVYDWSEQRVDDDKHVVELEGRTKRLAQWLYVRGPDGAVRSLDLIPAFQGAYMRVRVTVELIPCELLDDE